MGLLARQGLDYGAKREVGLPPPEEEAHRPRINPTPSSRLVVAQRSTTSENRHSRERSDGRLTLVELLPRRATPARPALGDPPLADDAEPLLYVGEIFRTRDGLR